MGAVGAYAIFVALMSASAYPAAATTDGYCMLWSRDVAELEVRAGAQLNLIFQGEELVYSERPDVDIATASAKIVEIRTAIHYHACMAMGEFEALPLPDLPTAYVENWATTVALYAVGRQGTEPAGVDPTPNRGSAEWRAACEAEYRTWDEADGTVVRRGSPERVPCPLKLIDGEWRVPE